MYVITNREILEKESGFDQLGERPNPLGPNELRLVEARRVSGKWVVEVLENELTDAEKAKLGLDAGAVAWRSQWVAKQVYDRLRREKKDLVFFVHGFNNDFKSVVERADRLEQRYGVVVLPFSWPANGGGASGVADYKSDKRDARASIGALDRTLEKMKQYLDELRARTLDRITEDATGRYGRSAEDRDDFIAKMMEKDCPFTVNFLLHSMGNYLFKNLLQSSIFHARELLFDNVVMVAADTNNLDHRDWVDRIQSRHRVYITINEEDRALRAARVKGGDEQLARLGHYPYNLDSRQSVYVDFTHAAWVRSSHAYFEGGAVRNSRVERFFHRALTGERAEEDLEYVPDRNYYRVA